MTRGTLRLPGALLAAAFLALSLLLVLPGRALAAPQASGIAVEMPDPASITFRARLTADADLASAAVNYKVLSADGNIGGSLKVDVSGRTADASATLQTNSNDRYIPVGTLFSYSWTITDRNGGSTTTPEQTFVFLDGRYQWQSRTQGQVSVYWYGGNEANADRALQATASSLTATAALLKVSMGAAPAAAPGLAAPPAAGTRNVTVQPGDSAWALAQQAGISLGDLMRLNPGAPRSGDWNLIFPGEAVALGAGAGSPPPAAAVVPAPPTGGGGASLNFPVRVVIYRNTADSKAAQRPRGGTFDSQVITGGSRVSAEVLHIYDPLGGFVDVARHEAAHIVTKVAGDGAFTSLPSWLDEGTAVFAQNSPGEYQPALQRAIQNDTLMRLRNMASATNTPGQVDIFYGQSWAVVKFMVDTYGRDKFAAVFKASKDGAPIDEALEKNIGVDQDGLYNAWRKSIGLKTIDYPPVPRSAGAAAPQATQAPLGIPTGVRSAENTAGGGANDGAAVIVSSGTAIAVGAGALLVAIGLGFVAFRMMRKA